MQTESFVLLLILTKLSLKEKKDTRISLHVVHEVLTVIIQLNQSTYVNIMFFVTLHE